MLHVLGVLDGSRVAGAVADLMYVQIRKTPLSRYLTAKVDR